MAIVGPLERPGSSLGHHSYHSFMRLCLMQPDPLGHQIEKTPTKDTDSHHKCLPIWQFFNVILDKALFTERWFGSFHVPTHLPSIPSRSFSCSAGVLPSRPSARGAFRAGLLTMHQPGFPKVRGFWIDLPLQNKNFEWDAITSSGGCRQSYWVRRVLCILILGAWLVFYEKSVNICDRQVAVCLHPVFATALVSSKDAA